MDFEPGLVSVVMPAYNRAAFVGEAVESVIAQTHRPVEVLVVDDGSSDATVELARKALASAGGDSQFRGVIIRQSKRGVCSARNEGLIHSRGEFVQYLDSDDVLVSRKIEHHLLALRRNEAFDMVWSDWKVVASQDLAPTLAEANRQAALRSANELQATPTARIAPWEPWPLLCRRRCVAGNGPWNERVVRWDDWEYVVRLWASQPAAAYMPGVYCVQRVHELGRHHDYEVKPEGVGTGLIACREAAAARRSFRPRQAFLDQLVADAYWQVGLEAMRWGTDAQCLEAFSGAMKIASRPRFRLKSAMATLALRLGGRRTAAVLLKRYL